jgi:hypothetical protein
MIHKNFMKVTAISVNGEMKSANGVYKTSQAIVTCEVSELLEEISYAKSEIKFKL